MWWVVGSFWLLFIFGFLGGFFGGFFGSFFFSLFREFFFFSYLEGTVKREKNILDFFNKIILMILTQSPSLPAYLEKRFG